MEASPRRSSSTPLYTAPLPSVHLSPVHAKANHPMKLRHENGTMIRKIQGWAKLSISSAGPRSSGSSSFSRLIQSMKVPIPRVNGDREQSPRRLAAAEETSQRSQRSQEDEAPPLQPVDVERVRTIEKVATAKIYLESY
ncbi:hypothetical protein CGCA056_v001043 [Colletotrichum aenigma]|uniref:uncharacterized protein n=1 Tax=Colletotrichum aenigma TaxID=1215731 RepID=UPI001872D065|nr:uncharacterized protein CGCA056_v001043 [Colletotrichum aenigma]KAF5528300.1 hypothetical protein CGCA056_v001043 [Colletotrichum aenigma]